MEKKARSPTDVERSRALSSPNDYYIEPGPTIDVRYRDLAFFSTGEGLGVNSLRGGGREIVFAEPVVVALIAPQVVGQGQAGTVVAAAQQVHAEAFAGREEGEVAVADVDGGTGLEVVVVRAFEARQKLEAAAEPGCPSAEDSDRNASSAPRRPE